MVRMRMRDDNQIQPLHAERAKLATQAASCGAGVEQGGVVSRSAKQHCRTLADVQHPHLRLLGPPRRPQPRLELPQPCRGRRVEAGPQRQSRGHDAYAHDRGESGVSRPARPQPEACGLKKGTRSPKGRLTSRPARTRARGTDAKARAEANPARPRSLAASTGASAQRLDIRIVHDIGIEANVSKATLNPPHMKPIRTLAMPRPVTGARAGTTNRLAKGETREVRPKTRSETGAVPRVAAIDTARPAERRQGACAEGAREA